MSKKIIATLALLSLLPLALPAQDGDGPAASEGPTWSLGLGAVVSPRPYPDADAKVFPVPLVGVRYKGFYFETIRTGYRWSPREHLGLDLFLAARFDGYDEDESPALTGMEERDPSADLGFRVSGLWDRIEVGFGARSDVLDRSDGQELQLDVAFPASAGGWRITPLLGLQWLSDDLVDYYYGVRPEEARPGRPAYEGEDTLNGLVELSLQRPFAGNWRFIASLEGVFLGSEIEDSPIVEDGSTLGGFLGFTYRFGGGR